MKEDLFTLKENGEYLRLHRNDKPQNCPFSRVPGQDTYGRVVWAEFPCGNSCPHFRQVAEGTIELSCGNTHKPLKINLEKNSNVPGQSIKLIV